MDIVNWIEEENKGRWNRPNLVAYALLESMANHCPKQDITETFAPFKPEALEVELIINGVPVSFTGAMNLIQEAISNLESDIRKSLIKDAATALISELTMTIEKEEWKERYS